MKGYFINLFELEEEEVSVNDVAKAAVSLFLGIGILFGTLFI